MDKPNNPPAFPIPAVPGPGGYDAHEGMSLRDWFAGQVVSSVLDALRREPAFDVERSLQLAAKGAYIIADAMLAERERTQ